MRIRSVHSWRTEAMAGERRGLAGLALIVGVALTWRQVQVTRQGQITDRFTAAVAQIGEQTTEVRIGGIYALERIARDSAMDRLTIVEVLTAFVRVHAALSPGTEERARPTDAPSRYEAARQAEAGVPLRNRAPYIQTAITVLGRLPTPEANRVRGALARVDLRACDLGYADLPEIDLHYSDLTGALLRDANLQGADLTGVWFARAVLIDARMYQADLRSAVLWQALLDGADLRAADLTGADLTGARLAGARLDLADLRGADLHAADLSQVSLRDAVADDATIWPEGFEPLDAGVRLGSPVPPLRPQNYFERPQI